MYHIVWVTHNSRISKRMTEYRGNRNIASTSISFNSGVNPAVETDVDVGSCIIIELNESETQIITKLIMKKADELNCTIHAINILSDHVHLLIDCDENNLSLIIGQIKGYSAREFNKLYRENKYDNITQRYYDGTKIKLWARKFSKTIIKSEEQFNNTMNYIIYNKEKQELNT